MGDFHSVFWCALEKKPAFCLSDTERNTRQDISLCTVCSLLEVNTSNSDTHLELNGRDSECQSPKRHPEEQNSTLFS